jgi:guanine deaminase
MTQIIKSDFIDTPDSKEFRIREGAYLVVRDGKISEFRREMPRDLGNAEFSDYSGKLMIPPFCDMHLHGPQFLQRGLGMDRELIGWLNDYTFPREARFADPDFARRAYEPFVEALYRAGTLRSSIFGSLHREGTLILAELLEEKGLDAYVGKVNMDSNSPDYLRETRETSLEETVQFLEGMERFSRIRPILTPRFVPSCSGGLLRGLGELAKERNLPVQSHLCETEKEVAWVRELFPDHRGYSHVYDDTGLFHGTPSLMAHGIYLEEDDLERIERTGTVLVHCPDSNLNLASGIMDVTGLLDRGFPVVLGSDVGGGHELPMNRVIVSALQASKIRCLMTGEGRALTHGEAFFMATMGGRHLWEDRGCFEEGTPFDGLLIGDDLPGTDELPPLDRLYRYLYTGEDSNILARYREGLLI